jgi:hypothetical protein
MEKYIIKKMENNEIIISFNFNKTSTILSIVFSLSILTLIALKIRSGVIQNIWGSLIILILLLLYLTFNKYYEWTKNKYHKFNIQEENLFINDKFHCNLNKLQSVNIYNSINKFESGWIIYLKIFPDSSHDYIIKKRLGEKEAIEIADKISLFLNRKVIID